MLITFCGNRGTCFRFRNPTLLSLVNKILPSSTPVERDMPCSEDLASSMNNYTIDRVIVLLHFYNKYILILGEASTEFEY